MVWRKGSHSFNKNQFQGTEYITYWKGTWNLTMLYKNVSFMLYKNTHQFVLFFEWEKEPNTNLLSNFTKMDFSRETSTREVFETAHLLTSLFSLSCFFPFWQVLQETAGRSGRRTGRKGSRNHQIYHPPWQWHHNSLVEMLAFGGTVPHPQTLRTFMLSTLEVSHRNPMATPWPGFQISAMLFFVEHSCSVYKDVMMAEFQACTLLFKNTWTYLCVVVVEQHGCLVCKKHEVVARDFCKSKKGFPINLWVLTYYLVFNVDQLSLTERFVAPLIGRNNMSPSSLPKTGVQWWQKDVSHQILLRS